jgi:hypothetical protein
MNVNNSNNANERQTILDLAAGHIKLEKLNTKKLYQAAFNKNRENNPTTYKNRNIRNNSRIVKRWDNGVTHFLDRDMNIYRVMSFEVAYALISGQTSIDYSKILRKAGNPNYVELFFTEDFMQFLYIELVYRWKLTRPNARNIMKTFYSDLVKTLQTTNLGSNAFKQYLVNVNGNITKVLKKFIFVPSYNIKTLKPFLY